MKRIIGIILIDLFFSCNLAISQDTLYIYRSGIVVSQRPVAEIDSVTFYRNYDTAIQPTVTDINGNVYHTVTIGSQTWMVENLKTTKYRNGDIVGTTTPSTKDISYESTPKYQWAFNGVESNVAKYGRLYTWYAATDTRNVAPIGWHVPTDAEWTKLENYLIKNGFNYDRSTTGDFETNNNFAKSLAATKDWNIYPSLGTIGNDLTINNKSGFTAFPAGNRSINGVFFYLGLGGYWWTSTEYDYSWAWNRDMGYNVSYMGRHYYPNKQSGFSIRCVMDSIPTLTVPTLTTTFPSSILTTSATSGGNVTNDGGTIVTARGICWSTKVNPTISDSTTKSGLGTGVFSSSITGLKSDSTYYVRAYATNSVGTAYGEQVSFKTLKTYSTAVTDIDGNVYHTINIGTQTWMVENLKTTKLNDGTAIPQIIDKATWAGLSTPGYCWYNNDSTKNKITKYGAIYNWYTVNTAKLAPKGWHVPTDAEWYILTTFLGGDDIAGGKLKETGLANWVDPNTGATNITGFSALPTGNRGNNDGTFQDFGIGGFWWTSTDINGYFSYFRSLGCYGAGVGRSGSQRINGLAVRCVRNSLLTISLPTLTTTPPTSILTTSAISGGNITNDGGSTITASGVCWSTSINPTILNSKTIDKDSVDMFISSITGLSADSTYYVRAYATNSVGTAYGEQVSFKTLKPAAQTVTDIDGNVYNTVKIGNQTWMKENLKATRFNDSTAIPLVTDGYEWINSTIAGYSWVNNDTYSKDLYGAIYNYYAVSTGKLAPKGWHVPSQTEIDTLTTYLGGYPVAGSKLKESGNVHWYSANSDATNSSGFTALPGGYRSNATGDFHNSGLWGVFWSSTELNGMGGRLILECTTANSDYSFDNKAEGFNVRCIKD